MASLDDVFEIDVVRTRRVELPVLETDDSHKRGKVYLGRRLSVFVANEVLRIRPRWPRCGSKITPWHQEEKTSGESESAIRIDPS